MFTKCLPPNFSVITTFHISHIENCLDFVLFSAQRKLSTKKLVRLLTFEWLFMSNNMTFWFPAFLLRPGREASATPHPALRLTNSTVCFRTSALNSHLCIQYIRTSCRECVRLPVHASILQCEWNCHLRATKHHITFITFSLSLRLLMKLVLAPAQPVGNQL